MTMNSDDTAARKIQTPRMTDKFQNKTLASSNVAGAIDFVDQGPPKDSGGITSMRPIGAGTHRGY